MEEEKERKVEEVADDEPSSEPTALGHVGCEQANRGSDIAGSGDEIR